MKFNTLGYILSVLLLFANACTVQSSSTISEVCSADIPGLCTQDFQVIGSTFGLILPPATSSAFEDDFIYKMIQPMTYGAAGLVDLFPNGTVSHCTAAWIIRCPPGGNVTNDPGLSLICSINRAQVMVIGPSTQVPSGLILESPAAAGRSVNCNIRISPFYLSTNTQVTAYVRLQGCSLIPTAAPTVVNFFKTNAAAVFSNSSISAAATFPIDSTFEIGSVTIASLDTIRTSNDSYSAALTALQLN